MKQNILSCPICGGRFIYLQTLSGGKIIEWKCENGHTSEGYEFRPTYSMLDKHLIEIEDDE